MSVVRGLDEGYFPGDCWGSAIIDVLPELRGLPWEAVAQAYVTGLRPSMVRTTHGEIKTDAVPYRVTVYLTALDRIEKIEQEVPIQLPVGLLNGFQVCRARLKLREQYPESTKAAT